MRIRNIFSRSRSVADMRPAIVAGLQIYERLCLSGVCDVAPGGGVKVEVEVAGMNESSLPLAFKIPYKILLIIWIKLLHATRLMTSIAPSSSPPGCVPDGFPPPPDSESVPPTALLLKLFLLLLSSCRVEREKTGFPSPHHLNKLLPDSSFTSPGTAGNKLLLLLLPSVGLRRRYTTDLTSFQWATDERCLRGHEKR